MSTGTPYYPPVDLATLRMLPVIGMQIENHGLVKYLEGAPWPPEAVTTLKAVFRQGMGGSGAEDGEEGEEDLDEVEDATGEINVERELVATYRKLKRMSSKLGSDQTAEKVQVFRITTSLLTKLVDLMEKASSINQYNEFRQAVMRLLSDVMTADQRNTFLSRLAETFGMPLEEEKTG